MSEFAHIHGHTQYAQFDSAIISNEHYVCHDHIDKTSPLIQCCNHLVLLAENTQYCHNSSKLVTQDGVDILHDNGFGASLAPELNKVLAAWAA